jgi:hypothetical protein
VVKFRKVSQAKSGAELRQSSEEFTAAVCVAAEDVSENSANSQPDVKIGTWYASEQPTLR